MNEQITSINFGNKKFPSLLKEIPNPPSKIFIKGELPLDETPKIAIVGTRKATSSGKSLAKKLAEELSRAGMVIVSGLAMGIDTAAHEGALAANGKTIAVLGNGLDEIYPSQNENLAKKILETGSCLVSEYPVGTPSYKNQFLERNRIISGFCIATIIIEAPERSGSLATANWAIQQGREVFVFPGPINHQNYNGSHKLIRDGARLVSSLEDIFEDLGIDFNKKERPLIRSFQSNREKLVYDVVSLADFPIPIDKIIELTKLDPQTINKTVALLIIEGAIKETEKGYTI